VDTLFPYERGLSRVPLNSVFTPDRVQAFVILFVSYIFKFYLRYEASWPRLQHRGGRSSSSQGNSVNVAAVIMLNEDLHRYPSLNYIREDQKQSVRPERVRSLARHLQQDAAVSRSVHLMGYIMHFVLVSSRRPFEFERLGDVRYVPAVFCCATSCLPELSASGIHINAYGC